MFFVFLKDYGLLVGRKEKQIPLAPNQNQLLTRDNKIKLEKPERRNLPGHRCLSFAVINS